MPNVPPARTPAERRTLLQVMWTAFLAAVVVYVPIPFFIAADQTGQAGPASVVSGLQFAALGAAVASLGAKRWWVNAVHAALARGGPGEAWARLQAGCIVTWALSEAVALLGLAAAILARRPSGALPLGLGAALLLYFHRPATWPVDAIARAEGGA